MHALVLVCSMYTSSFTVHLYCPLIQLPLYKIETHICYHYRYYIGIRPNIVVKNLEMLKQIMGKQFNCFVDRDVRRIILP